MKKESQHSTILAAIDKRASVRSFTKQAIPESLIVELLTAGTYAPSSGNMQPWEFIVIQEHEQMQELVGCTYFGYFSKGGNHQHWIGEAGVIFVVCANQKRTEARYGQDGKGWSIIDVSAAAENILLAATALGLAGCWVGGFDEKKVKELLRIPEYVKIIGLLPIGYPLQETKRKSRLPLSLVTHKGKYNERYF
ncbi:nitroreductase family protein [Bacillus horti]|uniref:Nitroreductase n=1 Tax=Caldalkalibacillus horti TaxID=77523 RepID=A0ABT9VY81_9BACI|nr:nitroreductase family protein [Bacillus horti]MDQ0165933.1 nitroreductase [Bacillus horti]